MEQHCVQSAVQFHFSLFGFICPALFDFQIALATCHNSSRWNLRGVVLLLTALLSRTRGDKSTGVWFGVSSSTIVVWMSSVTGTAYSECGLIAGLFKLVVLCCCSSCSIIVACRCCPTSHLPPLSFFLCISGATQLQQTVFPLCYLVILSWK